MKPLENARIIFGKNIPDSFLLPPEFSGREFLLEEEICNTPV
jgi:hypothetical protein